MAKWICSVCGYVHEGDTPSGEVPAVQGSGRQV